VPRFGVPGLEWACLSIALRAASFDHLVGAGEKRGRHCQSDCLGGLEIEDELDLGGPHNRQGAGRPPVKDPAAVPVQIPPSDPQEDRPTGPRSANQDQPRSNPICLSGSEGSGGFANKPRAHERGSRRYVAHGRSRAWIIPVTDQDEANYEAD
jgi:hypothetical protein